MKKFTEELKKLSTTDLRSVLRWLNNNVEKLVKPTDLASMKHDKALTVIEDKFKAADIEKALDALSSGTTSSKPKVDKPAPVAKPLKPGKSTPSPATSPRAIEQAITELRRAIAENTNPLASYVIDIGGNFFVIAVGRNGACTLDDSIFTTADAAHKAWPEAILPGPLAKEDDLKDLL